MTACFTRIIIGISAFAVDFFRFFHVGGFTFLSVFHGNSDFSEFFADSEILSVREYQKIGTVKPQFSVFINEIFIHGDLYHIGDKEVVGTEGNDLRDFALKGQRAVFDGWC